MSVIPFAISSPFVTGLATSAGLIIAIGAQNAFVLSQGLRRQYHWPIASLCGLIDALLITVGIAGMGMLISESPHLLTVTTYGGAAFLIGYGAKALRAALRPDALDPVPNSITSLRTALLTALALSLLNPHVYLDTVVLLGGIGGRYSEQGRFWFGMGAISFSFLWFFSLSLGARWLSPLFRQPVAWRVLDGAVCLTMWSIAAQLLYDAGLSH